MKAVILAAGRGTRMGDLTDEMPKPMLRVHDRPVLEHIPPFWSILEHDGPSFLSILEHASNLVDPGECQTPILASAEAYPRPAIRICALRLR